jgi:hypothetical protein
MSHRPSRLYWIQLRAGCEKEKKSKGNYENVDPVKNYSLTLRAVSIHEEKVLEKCTIELSTAQHIKAQHSTRCLGSIFGFSST